MMDQTTPAAEPEDNPLLVTEGLPPYDKIEPEHVLPAAQFVLSDAEEKLNALEQNIQPTWDGVVVPLDEIGKRFQWAWSPVSHLHGVKNSPELREAFEQARPHFVTFGLRISQSEPVYQALKGIREGDEWEKLDEAQRRIITTHLQDMELSGIGLKGEKRERFNEIINELSKLSTDFSNHVLDATKAMSRACRPACSPWRPSRTTPSPICPRTHRPAKRRRKPVPGGLRWISPVSFPL